MQTGFDSGDKPLLNVCAYVSFQELATRISHRNTGQYSGDPIAARLLTRIAMDENLHMVFYRNLVKAALEVAPSQTLRAITDEIVGFVMPGNVIPGFGRKALQIANAGIYDLRIHHDDVIMPLVRYWQVFELGGLDTDGERARRELEVALENLSARAARFVAHRAQAKTEHSPGARLSQPTLLFRPFGSQESRRPRFRARRLAQDISVVREQDRLVMLLP
jgi:acyl-[acyl-carrier-protein] desaturase